MLLLAAALAASTAPTLDTRRSVTPVVQAQATVRILSGVRLQLGRANAAEGQRLRLTSISTAEGVQAARLVEFE